MDSRQEQLANLKAYLLNIDKEITMILQNLQWDQSQLLQGGLTVTCGFNKNHLMPSDKIKKHEENCFLKTQGYSKTDKMLPEPLDIDSPGLVKLSSENIQQIINVAAHQDYQFKRGQGCTGPEPLTLERLQATYTADERRAIHDAVVNAVPSYHDLSELALPSATGPERADAGCGAGRGAERLQALAALRDMKRRRARHRAPPRSRNYSDVLRTVITTQMEFYSEALKKTDILNPDETELECNFESGSKDTQKNCEKSREKTWNSKSKEKNENEDRHWEHRCKGNQSSRRKCGCEDKYQRRDSSRKDIDDIHFAKERTDQDSDRSYKWRSERYSDKDKECDKSNKRKVSYGERDREKRDLNKHKSSRQEKGDSLSAKDRYSHRSYHKEDYFGKSSKDSGSSNKRQRSRDQIDEQHLKRHRYETSDYYESKAKYKRHYD